MRPPILGERRIIRERNEGEELLREKELDSREYFFISATNNRDY